MLNKIKNIANTEDKKRLLSNFFSLSILQGANYILPLLTLPYLVRVLGVENFGLLMFATATIAYLSIITDYGFNLTATREISIHRDNKEKMIEIFSSVMTIKVILMFFSLILLFILVFSFDKFSKDWLIYFMTFGTVVGQVLFPVWFFQGIEQMKYITIINISIKSFFTFMIFFFVLEANDYVIVAILTSLGFIISGAVGLYFAMYKFHISFQVQNFTTITKYLKDGYNIFVSQFSINLYRTTNIFILGLLTNNTIVGYYSIAERILTAIQNLQAPVGNALFPNISKKYIQLSLKESLTKIFKYSKYFAIVYAIATILSFVFASDIILLVSGKVLENSIINFQIMSLVIFIGGMNYYIAILGLLPLKYDKYFASSVIKVAIFNLIIVSTLSYIYQDIGTSISLVMSEFFLLTLLLKKLYNIKNIYVK